MNLPSMKSLSNIPLITPISNREFLEISWCSAFPTGKSNFPSIIVSKRYTCFPGTSRGNIRYEKTLIWFYNLGISRNDITFDNASWFKRKHNRSSTGINTHRPSELITKRMNEYSILWQVFQVIPTKYKYSELEVAPENSISFPSEFVNKYANICVQIRATTYAAKK